jgi:Acyl-CoA dehydrogenase, middle domain
LQFDYFHELIITQEITRTGARGYGDGINGGMVIGLPPVLNFGSPELQAQIVSDVFAGKKFIWSVILPAWLHEGTSMIFAYSLAISEAFAGSDVMGMKTTATLSEDGKHYIVNGTKKWITNGNGGSLATFFLLLTLLRL